MGAIKDLVDLVTQLDASRLETRTREAVLPIKEAALEVQRESFQLDQQHKEEIDGLKARHAEEMEELKAENAALCAKIHSTPEAEFLPQTGTWLERSSGIHYCPRCRQDGKWSPMQTHEHGWTCPSCEKFFENPENPLRKILPRQTKPDW
jgi:hypothetical protein